MSGPVIAEYLVGIIADHIDSTLRQLASDDCYLFGTIYRAGGVVGRHYDHGLCSLSKYCLNVFHTHLESVFLTERNLYYRTAAEFDCHVVIEVVRRSDCDFIARLQDSCHDYHERLIGARSNKQLRVRVERHSVELSEFSCERVSEFGYARVGAVGMQSGTETVQRLSHGIEHLWRRLEERHALAEADDVPALRVHSGHCRVQRVNRRHCDGAHSIRNNCHFGSLSPA